MDEIKNMLRAVINGQSTLKSELIQKIDGVEKKLGGRVDSLEKEVRTGFKKVNQRIDRLGKSLAYLEDDTPTREEFDGLEGRVIRVEKKISS